MDEGQKQCGRCKTVKSLQAFAPSMRAKASSWCRECRNAYTREKMGYSPREVIPVVEGHIRCGQCREFKPEDKFVPSQRTTGAWCKECHRAYYWATAPALPDGFGACEYCGTTINDAKDRRRRFCSGNCKGRARYQRNHPREPRSCDQCGVDITQMRRDARFCGDACAITWRNRNKTPELRRAERLWSKYRITPDDYDERLRIQKGVCAICRRDDPNTHHGFWHVDHDHATGLVRGLLCGRCNTGIGQFQDSPTVLERAAKYLRKPVLI